MKSWLFVLILNINLLIAQGQGPWNNALLIASSSDGINFNTPSIFQDSSGVPSIIKWKGDTLICVFQWFRLPNPSPTWDKVAVKFSYDNGSSWTDPTPIIVHQLPSGYQRPFDPTLVVINNDSLRLFFSSSRMLPPPGQDSIINSYSAISIDGINYYFEPNPRTDLPDKALIDPAVIYFKGIWHYTAPNNTQNGAFHFTSNDGIHFNQQSNITAPTNYLWTGNLMLEDSNECRFYGGGSGIWYNSTSNFTNWNGYIYTNIQGGDPSVVKISNNSYLMVYVGQPFTTRTTHTITSFFKVYPNPCKDFVSIQSDFQNLDYRIYNLQGKLIKLGKVYSNHINVTELQEGQYILEIHNENHHLGYKLIFKE